MELEQLFNSLKLVCINDAIRRDSTNSNQHQHAIESLLYSFKHWCYSNKLDYNSLRIDIFNPNPHQSLVLQWFKHHNNIQIYNNMVDIIMNNASHSQIINNHHNNHHIQNQYNHNLHHQNMNMNMNMNIHQNVSYHDTNSNHNKYDNYKQYNYNRYTTNLRHEQNNNTADHSPSRPPISHQTYQSYSSSNGDDTDDQVIIQPPEDTMDHSSHSKLNKSEPENDSDDLYEDILNEDIFEIDNSYHFKIIIAEKGNFTVTLSIFELISFLESVQLSTTNAVWHRIPKNEDELIGDKKSLCLCIHILICLSLQNKYKNSSDNQYLKFQQDPIYLTFLDKITTNLCDNYLKRSLRHKLTPNCLALTGDNKSTSAIVFGFGDMVENLPTWLRKINDILLNEEE